MVSEHEALDILVSDHREGMLTREEYMHHAARVMLGYFDPNGIEWLEKE